MPRAREFEIIERWFTRPVTDAAVRVGIGDDAAVVDPAGAISIAVDTLVSGTHFPATLAAHAVGHRSLAVNLSDLAAVGAKPRWATMALTLPGDDPAWIEDFAAGFFALAERYGVSLVGGDTTRGPLTVSVTLIGDQADAPLLRSGGRPGDRVFVSGTLGDSAAALDRLDAAEADRSEADKALIECFSYPVPRVDLGLALTGLATAAIDLSDGLVSDLGHIGEASGCGARLDLDRLPLSAALRATVPEDRALDLALHGGDDYELCFCVPPDEVDRARDAAAAAGTPVCDIGELTGKPGIRGGHGGEQSVGLEPRGFRHFE